MSETKPRILSSAVGRRRESVVSVRLVSGAGEITVNNKPASEYFPGLFSKMKYEQPFKVIPGKFAAVAKAMGGGKNGQLEALVLGIARALSDLKEENKSLLRAAGLLTRDSRTRQRRKVGTGGKARRRKQSPKR